NTVMFTKKQQPNFEKIKKIIEEKRDNLDNIQKQVKQPQSSGINDLEKLAKLKEKGIITEEEFNAKKKQILDL
ncbi:MAG: SHOCT domain-containing protein, partial [bacterium]